MADKACSERHFRDRWNGISIVYIPLLAALLGGGASVGDLLDAGGGGTADGAKEEECQPPAVKHMPRNRPELCVAGKQYLCNDCRLHVQFQRNDTLLRAAYLCWLPCWAAELQSAACCLQEAAARSMEDVSMAAVVGMLPLVGQTADSVAARMFARLFVWVVATASSF